MQISKSDTMAMYTIYFDPKDHPGKYVTRKWLIVGGFQGPVPTQDSRLSNSLVEARNFVPPGMTRIERSPCDDPVIVESWI